jgi:hypothetical protein
VAKRVARAAATLFHTWRLDARFPIDDAVIAPRRARQVAGSSISVSAAGLDGEHRAAVERHGWRLRNILAHAIVLDALVDHAQRPEVGLAI